MAEFAHNNSKNASTGHILFELNCGYHLKVLFKKDLYPCLRTCLADKLAKKLRKL